MSDFFSKFEPEHIISILSLLFAILIYLNSRWDKKGEKRSKIKFFWFREILLKDRLDVLQDFFDITDELADSFVNTINRSNANNLLTDCITNFNTEKRKVSRGFIYHVRIIDRQLYDDLMNNVIDFQDKFLTEIVTISSLVQSGNRFSKLTLLDIVDNQKVNLFQTLKKYHGKI